MNATSFAPNTYGTVRHDSLFDITLSQEDSFYLKMKAAGEYLVSMKSNIDIVKILYGITNNDIQHFAENYPDAKTYFNLDFLKMEAA